MKILNGKELAGYIEERQAKQVRQLRQAHNVIPKLAIILTIDSPVINTYIKLKQNYANDIFVEAEVYRIAQAEVKEIIHKLNKDDSIHGIIIQLPLDDPKQTEDIVNLVSPSKDVDGLGKKPDFEPATPLAIMWLLSAYNINLDGKEILIIGQGKLVGTPLRQLLIDSGLEPKVADINTPDLKMLSLAADVIISATGSAGLIKSDMIKQGAIVVDAGVAGEGQKTLGDVDPSIHEERIDLTITPIKGGVGPLTVCALFDNVIQSALKSIPKES